MDLDKRINDYFKQKSKIDVPDGLVVGIMDNIYANKTEDKRIYRSLRMFAAVGVAIMVFAISLYVKSTDNMMVIAGFYEYLPESYSQEALLSGDNITTDTMYGMLTYN